MSKMATLEEYRNRFNVPDWRKVEEYGYVEGLNSTQRRWEFLRRLPEYRLAHKNSAWHLEFEFGLREMIDPAEKSGESLIEIEFLDKDLAGALFDPKPYKERHYLTLPNPELVELAKASGSYAWFSENEMDAAIKYDAMPSYAELVGEAVLELMERGYFLAIFDPTIDLTTQANFAAQSLRAIDKRRKNNRSESFLVAIERLRAMDAFNEVEQRENKEWKFGEKIDAAREIFKESKEADSIYGNTLDDAYDQGRGCAFRIALIEPKVEVNNGQ